MSFSIAIWWKVYSFVCFLLFWVQWKANWNRIFSSCSFLFNSETYFYSRRPPQFIISIDYSFCSFCCCCFSRSPNCVRISPNFFMCYNFPMECTFNLVHLVSKDGWNAYANVRYRIVLYFMYYGWPRSQCNYVHSYRIVHNLLLF